MDDFAETLNQNRDGWNTAMGLRFVRVTLDEVVAELTIGPEHRQAYGIVHGGVYAGVIETTASVGAALNAMQDGRSAVGLENNTSFLHAVREGKLRVTALPMMRGRRTHVWEARVEDDKGRVVATGRVRMMCLEGDAKLAGRGVAIEK
jgi:1,4-dihydroxy-2-naphthoyl-CoA hydrolase